MAKTKGLGRGLDAFFGDDIKEVEEVVKPKKEKKYKEIDKVVELNITEIEPMLNQGKRNVHLNFNDDWTVYTDDGLLSAQWEHTFLVTEDGVEIISK